MRVEGGGTLGVREGSGEGRRRRRGVSGVLK